MQNDEIYVEAEVHMELAKGYRLKVSVHQLGLYINGFVALPSKEKDGTWKIYSPSQRGKLGKYFQIVEFNKHEPLWLAIEKACKRAVDTISKPSSERKTKDVVLDDISDDPIDLSAVPY